MSDKKYTPGPWKAKEEYSGWAVIANEEKKAFSISRLYICKEIEQGYDGGKADAKLIAAAPDLLEALLSVRRHGLIEKDGYETLVKQIGEAIHKATSVKG